MGLSSGLRRLGRRSTRANTMSHATSPAPSATAKTLAMTLLPAPASEELAWCENVPRARRPMAATASRTPTVATRAAAAAPPAPVIRDGPAGLDTAQPSSRQRRINGDFAAASRNGTPLLRSRVADGGGEPLGEQLDMVQRQPAAGIQLGDEFGGQVKGAQGTAARPARTAARSAPGAAPGPRGPSHRRRALRAARSPRARGATAASHRPRPCPPAFTGPGRDRWRHFRVPGEPLRRCSPV